VSLNKARAFTLVEVMVCAFILTVIMASLFMVLNIGEFSYPLHSGKIDLQAKVRQVLDWIVRDARQTNLIQINTNAPSVNHIKFKQVTGIDNATGAYTLSANYIEYNYDSVSDNLTRNVVNGSGSLLQSQAFDNITQPPFYAALGNPLDPGDILTSKKLIVIIAGRSQVKNYITLNFSLAEEVKIRNE